MSAFCLALGVVVLVAGWRFAQIDLKAAAVAGLVLILTVVVAWLVEIARGHSGQPYDWLAAIGGVAYVAAVALFRWRG